MILPIESYKTVNDDKSRVAEALESPVAEMLVVNRFHNDGLNKKRTPKSL